MSHTHLSFANRVTIQTLLAEKYFLRQIARRLNCSPSTILYERNRGQASLYHDKVHRYKAEQGQAEYKNHRSNCGRKSEAL